MTGDELKQRNIDTMGKTLGIQHTALFNEVASLNLYWKEFLEPFGTNDKRISGRNYLSFLLGTKKLGHFHAEGISQFYQRI